MATRMAARSLLGDGQRLVGSLERAVLPGDQGVGAQPLHRGREGRGLLLGEETDTDTPRSDLSQVHQPSPDPVRTSGIRERGYRARILEKMEMESNAELKRYAIGHRLVP